MVSSIQFVLVALAIEECLQCGLSTPLFVRMWYGLEIDIGPLLSSLGVYIYLDVYTFPFRYFFVTFTGSFLVGLLIFTGMFTPTHVLQTMQREAPRARVTSKVGRPGGRKVNCFMSRPLFAATDRIAAL